MSSAPRSGLLVPRASRALDNLRGFVILFALAFHSVLGYLNFLSASPFPFDTPPYLWRAFLNWPGRLLRKGKESSSSHTFRSTSPA